MNNKNIYLDTNIVADIIDFTRGQHLTSLELLEYFVLENYTVVISEDMITTLYYILKSKQEALEFFKELAFVDWKISTFGLDTLEEATSLALEEKLDLEDVLQCLCAKANNCKALITNDVSFNNCGLEIYTAENFLRQIKK